MSMSGQTAQLTSAGGNIPRGYAAGSLQKYTPEQMNLFQSLFGAVSPGSPLASMARGDQAAFAPYEEQANRNFQEFTGQLASRFSGQGLGGRRSSAFKIAQGQAASDFASQLAMQRQSLQRQALQDLFSNSKFLLGQDPYEQFLYKKQAPWWHGVVGAGLPIAGGAIGGLIGGQAGAAVGAGVGSAAAKGFMGG